MTTDLDALREHAARDTVQRKRTAIVAAVDALAYEAGRAADDAWACVDRLRADNVRLRDALDAKASDAQRWITEATDALENARLTYAKQSRAKDERIETLELELQETRRGREAWRSRCQHAEEALQTYQRPPLPGGPSAHAHDGTPGDLSTIGSSSHRAASLFEVAATLEGEAAE